MYCIYLWISVLVLEIPSSSFELATEELKSPNNNWSCTGGDKYLHCFKMSVISFIIVENFGKVSAFVVRKLRLLNALRSMISGRCCWGLCNICSLFYLIFILIYKNKLCWKIYCDDHSSLSCFFSFSSRSWVFAALNLVVANNCVVANNWFDRFIPTLNRGIINHGINRFSGSGSGFFDLWISYPGNK